MVVNSYDRQYINNLRQKSAVEISRWRIVIILNYERTVAGGEAPWLDQAW
jgi:hypothetical protein